MGLVVLVRFGGGSKARRIAVACVEWFKGVVLSCWRLKGLIYDDIGEPYK